MAPTSPKTMAKGSAVLIAASAGCALMTDGHAESAPDQAAESTDDEAAEE